MTLSKDEMKSWYYGVDTRMESVSLLIARSSTFPFRPFTEATQDLPEGSPLKERKRKGMYTVGAHKIGTVYDTHLRLRVREILSDVKWKTIDVVRLGYNDGDPPVVLITVDINDVDEAIAEDAVNKIHQLMIEFHLPDIHAEIKTGRLFQLVKYDRDVRYPIVLSRVPKMDASIGNAKDEIRGGSLCLFLKIDGSNYALSCQHVFTSSETPIHGNGQEITVQPAIKDREDYRIRFDRTINGERLFCKKYDADKLKYAEGEGPTISYHRETQATDSRERLNLISEKSEIEPLLAEAQLPFGALEYASGISKHPHINHKRDWALVKLNNDRFPTLPANILPPTHFEEERITIMSVYGRDANSADLKFNNRITTVLPLEELKGVISGSGPEDH